MCNVMHPISINMSTNTTMESDMNERKLDSGNVVAERPDREIDVEYTREETITTSPGLEVGDQPMSKETRESDVERRQGESADGEDEEENTIIRREDEATVIPTLLLEKPMEAKFLPSCVKIHLKYELKGSTFKRKVKGSNVALLVSIDVSCENVTYNALVKTIKRDCRVLESFKIINYSLLEGVHNLDLAFKEKQAERMKCPQSPIPREEESNYFDPDRFDDDVPSGGIPARSDKGDRLLIFVGIIDILQPYGLKERLGQSFKSMIHDGDTLSICRPSFYAQRFQNFMAKTVFRKIPSPLKVANRRDESMAS